MAEDFQDEREPFPAALTILILVGFVTLTLGLCLLGTFLYNLPVIFPPPGEATLRIGMASPTLAITSTKGPSSTLQPTSTPTTRPTLTAIPTATPTFGIALAPLQGRIIFVTERDGFNRIYLMSSDGSGQRQFVPYKGGYDYAPAVSPDGRTLAFSSNRDKPGTDNLYLMDMDGSSLRQITSTPNKKNASASWFPDGRRLLFSSNRDGPWQIYVWSDDGSVRLLIPGNPEILNAEVSPNGMTIAYTCGQEICLANPDGTNRRILLQNGLRKDHLAWSPDSTVLAFSQAVPGAGRTSVHIVDMSGRERQIVDNGGWPYWSPDGRRIVFSSDMKGVANLYVYDLVSSTYRQVTFTRAADITPIWIR